MKSNLLRVSVIASYALLGTSAFAEETITLDPVVVNADFREKTLSETTSSVSVIGEENIYDKSSQSFVETLASVPNVNFSSGASKAKYIQIRGIGETGQFETPLNPSVGLIVDGIDFSNITLGASLFDVKQIEVLRGPQGTTFGANGMAGVVTVQSNEPTKETTGRVEATVGNYNTKAFGAAIGGELIEDTLLGRFSIYKNTSDGYITNSFYGREDTNNIDELTAKAQLRWLVSDNHTIDFNYIHVDVDNGYDVFNQFSTRTTESDEPGRDAQKTDAFAIKSTYQVNSAFHTETTLSYSTSDIEYSYDEDWTYTGAYYTSFDQYLRDKKQTDLDIRLVSDEDGKIFDQTTDWIFGAYYKKYESDLLRNNTYFVSPFVSNYESDNIALYGQLDTQVNDKLKAIAGLRFENSQATYSDSDATNFDNDENLFGGKLGLEYQYNQNTLSYVTVSRGYKPSGFNPVTDASGLPKSYETEVLWNLDLGINSTHMDAKVTSRTNFFYGKRKDQQVGTSYVTESYKYTDYITNAEESTYYGLETAWNYYVNDMLTFNASLGLLQAEFDTFYNPVDDESKDGRAPAQSPEYQYNVGVNYMLTENWNFKTNVEGMGSYYFSNSHDNKSGAYALVNASLSYFSESWSATVWGRNLSDEEYRTRGYYFNNFGNGKELYTQLGSPRTYGFTLGYDF